MSKVRILSSDGHQYASDPHSRVHQGVMYHCSVASASIANDANLDMLITTPENDAIHMLIEAAIGGDAELLLYEGTTFTGGDVETVFNLKRTSTNTWDGVMRTGATITGVGTLLTTQFMPGGSRNQASGVASSFDLEWICKVSTTYMLRITNRSGAAQRASLGCNHYSSDIIEDS